MTTLAVDASKYTTSPPPVDQWLANGIQLVICQAHPANYGQARSLDLARAVVGAGLPWDAYVYQYLAYTDWLPGALETLDLLAAEGLVPRKVWLDVEDVDSGKDWTPAQRVDAVQRDLDHLDAWTAAHARPPAGIYSAAWYWRPYMGDSAQFTDRHLWAAQYDNDPDTTQLTLFGGWSECRIKQYAGSQPDGTDLDSLSPEEAATLNGGTVADCQTYKDALERGVNRIQIEVERQTAKGQPAAIRRTILREIASELFQALQT